MSSFWFSSMFWFISTKLFIKRDGSKSFLKLFSLIKCPILFYSSMSLYISFSFYPESSSSFSFYFFCYLFLLGILYDFNLNINLSKCFFTLLLLNSCSSFKAYSLLRLLAFWMSSMFCILMLLYIYLMWFESRELWVEGITFLDTAFCF